MSRTRSSRTEEKLKELYLSGEYYPYIKKYFESREKISWREKKRLYLEAKFEAGFIPLNMPTMSDDSISPKIVEEIIDDLLESILLMDKRFANEDYTFCESCGASHPTSIFKQKHSNVRFKFKHLLPAMKDTALAKNLMVIDNTLAVFLGTMSIVDPGYVNFLMKICKINFLLPLENLTTILSALGRTAMKLGETWNEYWNSKGYLVNFDYYAFVDIKNIVGHLFLSGQALESMVRTSALSLLASKRTSSEKFMNLVNSEIKYLADIWDLNRLIDEKVGSLKSWLRDCPNEWVTAGSSTLTRKDHRLMLDGKSIRTSKYLDFQTMTNTQIFSIIEHRSQYPTIIRRVIKNDPAKVRLAFSVDSVTYILFSYLFRYALLGKKPFNTTINNSNSGWLDLYTDWSDLAFVGEKYLVPMDFDSFDHQPTKEEILLCIGSVANSIRKLDIPEDWEYWYERLYQMLDESIFIDPSGNLPWMNGLVSGMRFTSEFGSMLNWVWNKSIATLYKTRLEYICVQGDDCFLVFPNWISAHRHITALSREGFAINANKFFISRKRSDFLRKEVKGDTIRSPFCRSVVAICEKKPWLPFSSDYVIRSKEMIAAWNTFMLRLVGASSHSMANIKNKLKSSISREVRELVNRSGRILTTNEFKEMINGVIDLKDVVEPIKGKIRRFGMEVQTLTSNELMLSRLDQVLTGEEVQRLQEDLENYNNQQFKTFLQAVEKYAPAKQRYWEKHVFAEKREDNKFLNNYIGMVKEYIILGSPYQRTTLGKFAYYIPLVKGMLKQRKISAEDRLIIEKLGGSIFLERRDGLIESGCSVGLTLALLLKDWSIPNVLGLELSDWIVHAVKETINSFIISMVQSRTISGKYLKIDHIEQFASKVVKEVGSWIFNRQRNRKVFVYV